MARGAITTRTLSNGEKRYYAALWVDRPGGGRKQIWKTFHKRRQAEDFLDSESKAVRDGEFFEPSKITFEDFAREWIEKYPTLAKLKPSTIAGYSSIIEAHLKPFFGSMRLSHIRPSTIEKELKVQLLQKLSPRTVRNILVVLQRMLGTAVQWDYLRTSPFSAKEKVKLPRFNREPKGRGLTPEEIRTLLDRCYDDTYVIVAVAIFTGMRRSEIFGLRWEDVDLERNQIRVKQALHWKRGKLRPDRDEPAFVFLTPKSHASIRKIDFGPFLRRVLLEHRGRSGRSDSELVFTNSTGGPVDPDNFVKRQFQPAVRAAGIGKLRFHDTRHSYGSLKIAQGENPKYVQVQMGHSDIKVTLDVYAHLLKDSNPEAAIKTERLVFGDEAELLTGVDRGPVSPH